jgi:hypothetical protein
LEAMELSKELKTLFLISLVHSNRGLVEQLCSDLLLPTSCKGNLGLSLLHLLSNRCPLIHCTVKEVLPLCWVEVQHGLINYDLCLMIHRSGVEVALDPFDHVSVVCLPLQLLKESLEWFATPERRLEHFMASGLIETNHCLLELCLLVGLHARKDPLHQGN